LRRTRFLREPKRRQHNAHLFYLPLIILSGMFTVAREDMRAAEAKTKR
jgi:hypothetical protein